MKSVAQGSWKDNYIIVLQSKQRTETAGVKRLSPKFLKLSSLHVHCLLEINSATELHKLVQERLGRIYPWLTKKI